MQAELQERGCLLEAAAVRAAQLQEALLMQEGGLGGAGAPRGSGASDSSPVLGLRVHLPGGEDSQGEEGGGEDGSQGMSPYSAGSADGARAVYWRL